MYLITQLQQAKLNENRVNIFLNDEYWISLNKNRILDLTLFKGKELSEEAKTEIETISRDEKLLEKVYKFIFWRKRSIKEVNDYLKIKLELDSEHIKTLVAKLIADNMLNDFEFCEWYVDNRLKNGIHGKNKIKAELIKKGVGKQIIEEVLNNKMSENPNEQESKLYDYAKKIINNSPNLDPIKLKQRLYSRLAYRGFSYSEIEKVLKELNQ